MRRSAFSLSLPDIQTTSVVFASPHSGRSYPDGFLKRSVLDELAARSSEDAFVDRLLESAPELGAPLISATMPRAYVDLNRAADELDSSVIEGVTPASHNPRVSSGLGVIPSKLKHSEAIARIENYWKPYHAQLEQLMSATRLNFGEAILADFHSMPHEAVESVCQPGKPRPEVVLGDRFGASAAGHVTDRIETIFLEAGLTVSRNAPFAGAYIAQHYGRPSRGLHAIQIEMDRSLYMNERLIRPSTNFQAFKELLSRVMVEIVDIGRKDVPLAAE
jgi:N-formylglutamate deformylase